jgi:hypothetical protein
MSDESKKINVLSTATIDHYPCGLAIHPGMNTLDAAAWEKAAKSDFMKAKIKRGVFRPVGAPPEPTLEHDPETEASPIELGKLKTKAALRAVAACDDADQLQRWLDTDGRLPVREAIIKQRYKIAAANEEAPEATVAGSEVTEMMTGDKGEPWLGPVAKGKYG